LDWAKANRPQTNIVLLIFLKLPLKISSFFHSRFTYIISKPSRYVLLMDRSLSMMTNDRWSLLRKSLLHFISAIPDGAELSIVTFSQQAVMNLSPTVVTEWNRYLFLHLLYLIIYVLICQENSRSGLHGRIPRRATSLIEPCLQCGFDTAFKALHNHRFFFTFYCLNT